PENVNKIGFTEELLAHLMQQCGLSDISYFDPFADDTSRLTQRGNIHVSLNLCGTKRVMDLAMVTAYVNTKERGRLEGAQLGFLRGALRHNIVPIIVNVEAGTRPKFGDLLKLAREHARSGWMLWCNSDCELRFDPRIYMTDRTKCYGFHRREIPEG